MKQKSEWEVVDDRPRIGGPQLKDVMRGLLGPAWRWKIAGVAVTAMLVLSVLALFAGIAIVGLITVALILVAAAKVRSVVHRFRRTTGSVQRHRNGPIERE